MADPSGPDSETERRQLRPRDPRTGLWAWTEDVFVGGAEVVLLGLPGLFYVASVPPGGPERASALTVILVMGLVIGTRAGDWIGWGRRPWPPRSPPLLALRFVYYNAVLVVLIRAGALVALVVSHDLAAVPSVGLLAAVVAWSLPVVVTGVRRLWGITG